MRRFIKWSGKFPKVDELLFKTFCTLIYSLPNDKILDLSKLKSVADSDSNVSNMAKFVFDRVEKIVGKGENAGYQHFVLFPHCFQQPSSFRVHKLGDCVVKG